MLTDIICIKCKHWINNDVQNLCKAFPKATKKFPKGIPWEIISGENDHSRPLPDQGNDIVFEPIEEEKE